MNLRFHPKKSLRDKLSSYPINLKKYQASLRDTEVSLHQPAKALYLKLQNNIIKAGSDVYKRQVDKLQGFFDKMSKKQLICSNERKKIFKKRTAGTAGLYLIIFGLLAVLAVFVINGIFLLYTSRCV